MQDRYAGDIGDFGKFGLLKAIEATGLSVGVNWYLTEPVTQQEQDNGDGKHLIAERYIGCDSKLAGALLDIAKSGNKRTVRSLENAQLLECSHFFAEPVALKPEREQWHMRALVALSQCNVVFLDPDNDIKPKSVREGSAKSVKYAYLREIVDYISQGSSVIVYNHRHRKKEERYFEEFFQLFSDDAVLGDKQIIAITFPKCTIRDYFIISANTDHASSLREAVTGFVAGPFGEAKLVKLQPYSLNY